jgi:KUP system potassium uptake protein
MVKCRPDFAPHIIKLSQYLNNPAKQHYEAARMLAEYLASTITEGIYYWRDTPVESLPEGDLPTLHSDNYTIQAELNRTGNLEGLVDSDWAADTIKRKSITGLVIMFAGGAIAYKSKYQEVIALSTTEAEFVAACDAAKFILFIRSILEDLGLDQPDATILFEDNQGALLMANAQQPTRRTRHMDIKHFSLLEWVEKDLILLKAISTHDNAADAMTKFLPRQLFFRHYDTYMGRRIPKYASAHQANTSPTPISQSDTCSDLNKMACHATL